MAITIGDLQVIYSGGASNTSQMASLGGAASTAVANKVLSQAATAPVNVTGVTILDAMGNPEGVGTLFWNNASKTLLWKPFGVTSYVGIVLSGNGVFTVGDSQGYIYVSVVYANLPATTLQDSITISTQANKVFDNISALESLNGDVEYRCMYVKNTNAVDTAYDIRLWIKSQPLGSDTLALCLDNNGKNGTARGPLADEGDTTNILTGLVFTAPSSYAASLQLGNLLAGDVYPFWIKRSVPTNTTVQMVNDLSSLAISALI